MKIKLIIITLMLFFCSGLSAQSLSTEQAFQTELRKKNEQVTSIKCKFIQTREVSMLAKPVSKEGEFYFLKPNNMLLNFNDGDYTSTIQEGNDWISGIESPEKYTNQMYDYGNTTLISDKSRVYKGGSWADGPYYLSPSTRRFMNEDESSSTVGFRCAMNKIGSALAK